MHGLLLLFVQIGVVLVAARAVGALFRRIGQPQVVGEMVAGLMLGPSLLGWAAPGVSAALFPAESLALLGALSGVGLLLFMFLVGLELDPRLLRGRGHAAVVTSHASIIAPFALGALLALVLYPRLADASIGFTGFALFMGAAMSVTAFPVLARILAERNLLRTRLGAVTLACAAVDDVTAWSLLAVVIALVRADASPMPLWASLGGTVLYVLAMLAVVRPLVARLERLHATRGRLTQDVLAVVLLGLLASAAATEWLGVHALFGAFLFGAVLPRARDFVRDLTEKLEDVTVVLLLPLFFAATGLRTSIGLVSGAEMWGYAALVLAVAVAGKFGGSALAARLTGLSWREAGALGILMNTRGLMELVILTIGLELGVITPALFAMMVLMALVTTFMTTPILAWLYPDRLIRADAADGDAEPDRATVLVPVALPSSGPGLLRVARALAPAGALRVYGLHLARADAPLAALAAETAGQTSAPASDEAAAALDPLVAAGVAQGVDVRPLSFVSRAPGADIADVAHVKGADLVLMGWHKPVVVDNVLGGTVADVLRRARADVAIYVQRAHVPWRRVLVPLGAGAHDRAALALAARIGQTTGADVTALAIDGDAPEGTGLWLPDGVALRRAESAGDAVGALVGVAREGFDLVVVGLSETWASDATLLSSGHERLARDCPASLLLVRAGATPGSFTRHEAGPGRAEARVTTRVDPAGFEPATVRL